MRHPFHQGSWSGPIERQPELRPPSSCQRLPGCGLTGPPGLGRATQTSRAVAAWPGCVLLGHDPTALREKKRASPLLGTGLGSFTLESCDLGPSVAGQGHQASRQAAGLPSFQETGGGPGPTEERRGDWGVRRRPSLLCLL